MSLFIALFLATITGGFVQLWLTRSFARSRQMEPVTSSEFPPVSESQEEEDDTEEQPEEEEDSTFLGFPSQLIAETAVSRLGKEPFNVSCPYCKAKKPKWDVLAHSELRVDTDTRVSTIVLSCPTCASVRMVNPRTLGVLSYTEDGESQWTESVD